MRRTSPTDPARLKWETHQKLFSVLEGALVETFNAHPEYLTPCGQENVLRSATKRLAGQVAGAFDLELRKQGSETARYAEGAARPFSAQDAERDAPSLYGRGGA